MANLITAVGITRSTLEALLNSLQFTATCYRGFNENHFGNAVPPEGATLKVRLPREYKSFTGWTYVDGSVTDQYVEITIDTPRGVSLNLSDAELALEVDRFEELFTTPAGNQMAQDIDFQGLGQYKKVWNQVGIPNDLPDSTDILIDAGAVLKNNSIPYDGNWTALIDNYAAAGILKGNKTLFNPTSEISEEYRRGVLGMSAGFSIMETQNIHSHLCGNFGTSCALKVAPTEGSNTLVLDTFVGVTGDPSALEGDIFTIEGVNMVNFKNKQDVGRLQQFVVESATWNAGDSELLVTFAPVVYASTTSPFQNVTALGTPGAAVVFTGTQNSTYRVGLAYHKNAFCFLSADLNIPTDCEMASVKRFDDVSLRFYRQFEGRNAS